MSPASNPGHSGGGGGADDDQPDFLSVTRSSVLFLQHLEKKPCTGKRAQTLLLKIKPSHLKFCLSINALHGCVTLYLHLAAQLFQGTHVVVYRSDCLTVNTLYWVLMPICFMRKWTNRENTWSLSMATNGYWACKALILRASFSAGR